MAAVPWQLCSHMHLLPSLHPDQASAQQALKMAVYAGSRTPVNEIVHTPQAACLLLQPARLPP